MLTTTPRQISMGEPRTFEQLRLRDSEPSRIREIGVVGTAYDSVLGTSVTYVSTPITSGIALYAAMDAAGVTSVADLKRDAAFFRTSVIDVNIAAADAVAERMTGFGGAVIAPAAFEARSLGWSQDDYMGLWLDVIERRATRLAMVDGWEYSNGGAEEYLQALLMQADRRDRTDIVIVDARGDVIDHLAAIRLLAAAVEHLIGRGFEPTVLARTLSACIVLHGMLCDEFEHGQSSDSCGRRIFRMSPEYAAGLCERREMREGILTIRHVLEEASRLLRHEDANPRSSAYLSPGLIRSSGRTELAACRATVIPEAKDLDS